MTALVISFATARPAALARRAKRDPFLGLHPRRKAITIDREPDGTFCLRLWPLKTPRDEAFVHAHPTAAEARSRAQNAVRNRPDLFQFVVDRSEAEVSGGDA